MSASSQSPSQQFFLIGGFLGAGKTTLIGHFTQWLKERDRQVGLVTNDQGEGLLDTASATAAAGDEKSVREITGGCFCCRLDDLVIAIRELDQSQRPDAIIAEPVGSCTDLMATVIRPLEQVYKMPMSLAPLSVVLDACRALASLGGRSNRRSFHKDVGYVYRKQLEEAEWLVINKIDLLSEQDRQDLENRLEKEFPSKPTFFLSAKTGEGLETWFDALIKEKSSPSEIMDIDYERYAVGEALLGWVNQTATCKFQSPDTDPAQWLLSLGQRIARNLDAAAQEVGHFKMSLEIDDHRHRVHQVLSDDDLHLITEPIGSYQGSPRLLVNLRAEGEATELESTVMQAIAAQSDCQVTFIDQAAFQPGEPQPTHRITQIA